MLSHAFDQMHMAARLDHALSGQSRKSGIIGRNILSSSAIVIDRLKISLAA